MKVVFLFLVLMLPFEGHKVAEPIPVPVSNIEVIINAREFIAPLELTAGYHTIKLKNNTEKLHAAHLIKLDDGYTADQLLEAYAETSRKGLPRPDWMTHWGGVISGKGSSQITLFLKPGNYVWVCVMGDGEDLHFAGHEHQALVVRGKINSKIKLAEPDVLITMQDDNHYLKHDIQLGKNVIDIVNEGSKYHLVAISRLNEGKSATEMIEWFQTYNGPPPAENIIATSAIGPRLEARIELDITKGNYVLYCMANAEGHFHLMEGAYQTFEID